MASTRVEPEYQDTVRHTKTGVVGVVDAKYIIGDTTYIDVIEDDVTMHEKSPISGWEIVTASYPDERL